MKIYNRSLFFAALLTASTIGWLVSSTPSSHAAPASDKKTSTEPFESDMHEFMEYVFQPTFKRLQSAMATEPDNN